MPDTPKLIFVHIAKTAGTTLNFLLQRHFFHGKDFGAYDGNMDSNLRSSTGIYEPKDVADAMQAANGLRRKQYSFLPGHMRFGLHEYVDGPATYITFLRDPVERVFSAYNYVRSLNWLSPDVSLTQFVDSGFLGNNNAMVRQLVNDPDLDTKENPALVKHARSVTREDCEQAKQNIDKYFLFAAPHNRFNEALLILADRYQLPWEKLLYDSTNITPGKISRTEITDSVRAAVLKHNEWDQALFDYATQKFDDQMLAFRQQHPRAIEQYLAIFSFFREAAKLELSGSQSETVKRALSEKLGEIQAELMAADVKAL